MAATSATLTKSMLRQTIKKRLASMSKEERQRQSALVTRKVLESREYQQSKRICLYLSMDEEVATNGILLDVFTSGKQCFVPRYTPTDMQMLLIRSLEDYENLPKTKWNIRQPESSQDREEALESGGLDLMLVPGLAFTKQGQRLGRGKGYYDRYLERCNLKFPGSLVTFGLAFQEQIVPDIPTTEYDMTVNKVLYAI